MRVQKDTITVVILRRADIELPITLAGIAEFLDRGDGVGALAHTKSVEIPTNAVQAELWEIGNDGDFFGDADVFDDDAVDD